MVGVGPADPEELRDYLASVAVGRMRTVLPVLLVGITAAAAVSPLAGVALTPSVIAVNAACLATAVLILVGIRRRWFGARHAHVLGAITWLLAPTTTLAAQHATGLPWYALPLMLELTTAAIQVHTGWMIGSIAVAIAAWLPLAVRDAGDWAGFQIASVIGGAIATIVTHVLLRRAMVIAERERRAVQASRDALATELAERRKVELDREQFREQFVHAQRMEAVGTLAAGLAHDLNNILGGILMATELVRDEGDDATRRVTDCELIIKEAQRGAALTRSLLAYSRRGQYRRQIVSLAEIVEPLRPLLSRTLPKSIEIQVAGPQTALVDVDPAQVGQAVMNLCLNGADAMAGTGKLVITTGTTTLDGEAAARAGVPPGRTWATIAVTDTGCGMDAATCRRIFEPFFTTKPIGKGTGLGLAMVYGAVSGHDGAIDVESEPGRGSTFRLYFPIADGAPEPIAARHDSGRFARRHTVLVVDDEPMVRSTTQRVLEHLGLAVLSAENGAQALEVYDQRRDDIALVVLDMGMPVMGGAECFRHLRERSRVPVLVASGYADDSEAQSLLAAGGAAFIDKPFTADDLAAQIERLLSKPGPTAVC